MCKNMVAMQPPLTCAQWDLDVGNDHVYLLNMRHFYVQVEMLSSVACRGQQRERDVLLRALVEAEIDGAALANQLAALKETVDGITKVDVVLVHHDHLTVAPEKNEYRHNEHFRVVVRNILSFRILFLFRRSDFQNHTHLLLRGSRTCCLRRLRCLVTRITAFESSSESGVNTRYRKWPEGSLTLPPLLFSRLIVSSAEGVTDVGSTKGCIQEEGGRQRGREHCQYDHPDLPVDFIFFLAALNVCFFFDKFCFLFSFSCSDFWPNWPTKRRSCPSLQSIWTLKRFF